MKTQMLMDSGSGVCIISPDKYNEMQKFDKSVKVSTLFRTHYFSTVDKEATALPCSGKIVLTMGLKIRHAVALNLRNAILFVAYRSIPYTIIEIRVRSILGLEVCVLLEAARDKFNG